MYNDVYRTKDGRWAGVYAAEDYHHAYNNFAEELFTLKKTGFLTARELFEPTPEQEEDMVESMQPEAPKTPPSADDQKLLAFLKIFVASVKEPGLGKFREIALDSLLVCDELILSTDRFVDKCFSEVFDDELRKRIIDRTKLEWSSSEVEFKNISSSSRRKEIVRVRNRYRYREMRVTRSSRHDKPPTVLFDFIETKKGYRLWGRLSLV